MNLGIAGRLTRAFIQSPLTPLFLLAALAVGLVALLTLPREEEPQISVPMVDIFVQANGLRAEDAVKLVTEPLETIVKSIDGVEHVYSQTRDDNVMVTARFLVGTSSDAAILRVHEKLRANLDRIPRGIPEPLIVGRGGTLWELLRRLVDRSPVVPLFAWRNTAVEPVALADVTEALVQAVLDPGLDGRSFDITGAERMTLGAMVRGLGHARGRHRVYLPLPGYGERIMESAAWTLARLPRREARLLLETLREPQVCRDPSRRFPLPHRPMGYAQALAALDAPESGHMHV